LLDGVLLALPYLCRSVGIVLIPVGLLLLWRARRPLRWTLAGLVVVLLPWFAWTAGAVMEVKKDPVEGDYTDYVGWWLSFGLPTVALVRPPAVGQVGSLPAEEAGCQPAPRPRAAAWLLWAALTGMAANLEMLLETPLVHHRQESPVAELSGRPVSWSAYETLF